MAFERAAPKSRDELIVRSDLEAEVRAQLEPLVRQMEMRVRAAIPPAAPAPQITVTPSPVSVSAPDVNVTAQAPESVPPDVNVTVPGLEAFAAELKALRGEIVSLRADLAKPVTKRVTRNTNGTIDYITETR